MKSDKPDSHEPSTAEPATNGSFLAAADMGLSLSKQHYREELQRYRAQLNLLSRIALEQRRSILLVFEGWDAGGKGGAIRRLTGALNAHDYRIVSIAAPTEEELAYHYLWRFWRVLPRAGRVTIFDRSWYGRVLVERVEEFATEVEWRRAYSEINDFEAQVAEHGTILLKFWMHITPEEQWARFLSRQETPHKSWKLTDEDFRNRDRWGHYEEAVEDMLTRTSTDHGPWHLIEANDKRFARVKVLRTACERLALELQQPELRILDPDPTG